MGDVACAEKTPGIRLLIQCNHSLIHLLNRFAGGSVPCGHSCWPSHAAMNKTDTGHCMDPVLQWEREGSGAVPIAMERCGFSQQNPGRSELVGNGAVLRMMAAVRS